jgi:hypothetical protein
MRSTPFGNNLLAEFAMKAIESEELGKDITDFLTVGFLFNRLCGSFIRSKINGFTRILI